MTDFVDVKLKALPRFPSAVTGINGIAVEQAAGSYTVGRDDGVIQQVPTISAGDLPNFRQVIYDTINNSYSSVPYSLSATAGVASLDGETGALDIDGTLDFTGSTLGVVGNTQQFNTRADARDATIRASITRITINAYDNATGTRFCPAPYKVGTSAGPAAFQDAGGRWWEIDLTSKVVKSPWFGIKADNSTTETTLLQAALDSLAAVAAADHCEFRIIGICKTAMVIPPDNIKFTGAIPQINGFSVPDGVSLSSGIFQIINKSNVSFRGVGFYGNLVEPGGISTGAIYFGIDNTSSDSVLDCAVEGCYFSNFKTSAWVHIVHNAQSDNLNQIIGVRISRNIISAAIGCAPTFALAGVTGNAFCRIFANSVIPHGSRNGSTSKIIFTENYCTGYGLSTMFAGFTNVKEVLISNNNTQFMGNNTLLADRAYTYYLYNSSPTTEASDPENFIISDNVGTGHHSNAIYVAGGRKGVIKGNQFSFTFPSGLEPTLPHGAAIAVSGVIDLLVEGNVLTDSLGGIAVIFIGDRDGNTIVAKNVIRSSLTSTHFETYGILLSPGSVGTGNCLTIVEGNAVTLGSANGIPLYLIAGFLGRLTVRNNALSSPWVAMFCSGTIISPLATFSGNDLSGALANYAAVLDFGSSPLSIDNENVDFSGVVAGASGGYILDGNTKATISNLSLRGKTNTGAALSMIGTRGRCHDVTFPATTSTRVAATSSGLTVPTWTGEQFDTWQNFGSSFYTETGSTPKYTLDSWVWATSTTWLERRFPTGG